MLYNQIKCLIISKSKINYAKRFFCKELLMKRLLCIVAGMNTGGAETFLMKIYRELDRTKFQMDFCVTNDGNGYYDDEIQSLGGKIYHAVAKSKNPIVSFVSIMKIVKSGDYKYVMRISQHSLSVLELLAAKFAGAKVLVFRSSNSKTKNAGIDLFLHKLFIFLPRFIPTVKIAPSTPAAEHVFGKKSVKKNQVILLNNAIPLDSFLFNREMRDKTRKKLGIETSFIIGHVGRFSHQKNHEFLIKTFSEVNKKNKNAKLLLIGTGEKLDEIITLVKSLNLDDNVCFLGVRSDIPDLLMAMDLFVFPSFYEGMPNTIIEAQATGLPCIVSDSITKEVNITNLVEFYSLNEGVFKWTEEIIKYSQNRVERTNMKEQFVNKGYDISNCVMIFIKEVFEK